MVKKKSKKERPHILSFLLREFKERPLSLDSEKKEKSLLSAGDGVASLGMKERNITSLLLSCLSLDFFRRLERAHDRREKVEKVMQENDDEDAEMDDNDSLDPDVDVDLAKGRFEVLPSNPLAEDYLKRAGDAARSLRSGRIKSLEETAKGVQHNSDNYRQMYLDQCAKDAAMTPEKGKQIEEARKIELEAAAKLAEETQKTDTTRLRAREIQNKIAWWQQQSGIGQYDDATINLNIDLLQRELGTIPTGLW
jgi:hypothetical protein